MRSLISDERSDDTAFENLGIFSPLNLIDIPFLQQLHLVLLQHVDEFLQ